ncbi:glycosyltransferase 87 family protein [Streptomyces sp. YIM 130001]|uniref:glycosyltransferase 87 family protein n=1 Tax=Streptomyces sp. YIM 130001 TaxID=2259644 RepID=UPI000E65E004|nr:glycosyltransferase 87 family protein [Streptomyces sp. YIM 130001]
MLVLLARDGSHPLGVGGVAREVYELYFRWYGVLADGGFPLDDPLWQYPPAAGPVILAPGLVPGASYFQAFVAMTLIADAVVVLLLVRAGRRPGRSLRGALLWTCSLPLLLHIPLARYDVQVTAFAVAALLALPTAAGRTSPVKADSAKTSSTRAWSAIAGACAAAGAVIKVWPALVLLGTPPGRITRTAWTAAAATAAGLLLLLAALFTHPFDFLSQQGDRGVQIESLGGTVLSLARQAGWPGEMRYQYGSVEFVGPYVPTVAATCLVLTVLACVALVGRRIRAVRSGRWTTATPYDAALCAVLLFTVTSRVISPQYLIWLLGLAAVCLTSRATTQRPVAAVLAAAAAVSTLAYPTLYEDVMTGTWTGCLVMLVRNGLLVTAAVLSWKGLWSSTTKLPGNRETGANRENRSKAKIHS